VPMYQFAPQSKKAGFTDATLANKTNDFEH
jgi:hypothetical protein